METFECGKKAFNYCVELGENISKFAAGIEVGLVHTWGPLFVSYWVYFRFAFLYE